MWKKALLLMFVGFSVGCTSSVSVTPTQLSGHDTNDSATPTIATSVYTPELTNVSFEQISISHKEVQVFTEHSNFQLFVKISENTTGVFNLSNGKIENEQTLSDSVVSYPIVSMDGVLLAQINRQNDKKVLQIKNFSTNEESSIVLPDEAVLPKWLDSTKLAIWGGTTHVQCLSLLLIYDNSTAEVTYPVHPMPDLQKSECLQLPFLTTDGTKMIYPWQVFDFQTGTSNEVFSFMRNVAEHPPSYSLNEANGNVSIAFMKGNMLNYLLNTPLAEINNVDLIPEMALLPGLGTFDAWWQPFVWMPSQMQIGVDLLDQDTDPQALLVAGRQVPTKFYLVDFAAHKIFDYDLDRAVFVEGSPAQRIRIGFPSPDGKYFAWTIYDSSSGLPIGSKVLELSSGYILSIPEIELLGWIVSNA